MITIVSQPQELNYTLSLPTLLYKSDKASTTVTLYRGTVKILEEKYFPFDASTPLELYFDTLIDGLQTIDYPKTEEIITHANAAGTYKIIVADSDGSKAINFTAMKGFHYSQPMDLNLFFSTAWLNIPTLRRQVRSFQPVHLTAFARQKINIKVKVFFEDNSTQTFSFGTMVSGSVQTVDISPYLVQQRSTKKIVEYSVFGADDTGKLNMRMCNYVIDPMDIYKDDYFVFLNRLGGWESISLTGQKTNSYKSVPSVALFDKRIIKYADDRTRTVKKNTGYITGHTDRILIIEMINSDQCYHILDGAARLINFKEPTVDLTDGTLNEADLEFTYSDPLLANPRIEKQPNYLTI
ncbi:hypothetical protein AAW12_15915 [Sphingobacterium sp. Ag1]|uniref:hypothetical protein n=1 Tax=Sphingobacterium sp. Ag1 TaxID=1643451 RepID=UPI000627737F|nr:hypothetical protein [Sphingobacterium sp. Ag1]KKO90563.1 hypothetical protein AAW12_15915 [Sphingobacterium sp. Ag1]